jgi:hypothetical protein
MRIAGLKKHPFKNRGFSCCEIRRIPLVLLFLMLEFSTRKQDEITVALELPGAPPILSSGSFLKKKLGRLVQLF